MQHGGGATPRLTPRRLPSSRSPRLTSSGWAQVCRKQKSAPHETRFARVPGGWRSRVVTLSETSDALKGGAGPATDVAEVVPVLAAPWAHERQEEPRLKNKLSQASLTARSMTSSVSRTSLNSLLRPGATFQIEKRPPRRECQAWRQWPARYIEAEKKKTEERKLLDAQQNGAEDDSDFGDRRGSLDEEELLNHRGALVATSILERLQTVDSMMMERRMSARRRSSARSVGGVSTFSRRGSLEVSNLFSGVEPTDLEPSRERGFPAAVLVAEEEEENAQAEGCSHLECRARRLNAFSEALLSSPEVMAREESGEKSLGSLGAGLLDAAPEDEEDFSKLQHDQVRELAALFVEFDGDLTGFIRQHDLRSLLRRAGRALSAEEILDLLNSLNLPNWDDSDTDSEFDFLDLLELLDMREHTERLYLLSVFRQKFKGAGGGGIRPEIRELAKTLEGVHITLNAEQVRRTAAEMGLPEFPGYVMIHREAQLFLLAERCRKFEKLRVHERAGFSLEQVQRFQYLYEQIVKRPSRGATLKEMTAIMNRFPIPIEDDEMKGDLEEIFYCGRDEGTELGFWDCLHAARRFQDKKDMNQLALETIAASEVGIPRTELVGFRNFYEKLIEEDNTKESEFTFFTLSKAVRIMGATLTMEKNAELEQLFRYYAVQSRLTENGLHLSFSQFIRVVGQIFKADFAGIRSWTEGKAGKEAHNFRIAGLTAAWAASRRSTRRSGLV